MSPVRKIGFACCTYEHQQQKNTRTAQQEPYTEKKLSPQMLKIEKNLMLHSYTTNNYLNIIYNQNLYNKDHFLIEIFIIRI